SDINITDYSNAVSYVFFLSALTLLILPPYKWERALHIGVSAVCAVTVIVTTYAIIINSENLLYITVIFTAVCCLALSGAVLYQSFRIRQLRTARIFAYSMLFLGLLDVAVYLSFILGLAVNVQTIFISMYTPLYVWICGGLLRLRKEV
ncbi:MAG: hypothetical protein FWF94_08025, partial [Oscillospiraceae bacterium]|nr:hypothetical protein [Oscillospiraceae bacterium]